MGEEYQVPRLPFSEPAGAVLRFLPPASAAAVADLLQHRLGDDVGDCPLLVLEYLVPSVRVEVGASGDSEEGNTVLWALMPNSTDTFVRWSWISSTTTLRVDVFRSGSDERSLILAGGWSWRPHDDFEIPCYCTPIVRVHGQGEAAVVVVGINDVMVKLRLNDGKQLKIRRLSEWHHEFCGLLEATNVKVVVRSNQAHIGGLHLLDLESFELDTGTIDVGSFCLSLPGGKFLTRKVGYIGGNLEIHDASSGLAFSLEGDYGPDYIVTPVLLSNQHLAVAKMLSDRDVSGNGSQSLSIYNSTNGSLQCSWRCPRGPSYNDYGYTFYTPMCIAELRDAPETPTVVAVCGNNISLYQPSDPSQRTLSWRTRYNMESVHSLPNQFIATVGRRKRNTATREESEDNKDRASEDEEDVEDEHSEDESEDEDEDEDEDYDNETVQLWDVARIRREVVKWAEGDQGAMSPPANKEIHCDVEIELPEESGYGEGLCVFPGTGRFSFGGVLWKLGG